jgi:hypothetical protein
MSMCLVTKLQDAPTVAVNEKLPALLGGTLAMCVSVNPESHQQADPSFFFANASRPVLCPRFFCMWSSSNQCVPVYPDQELPCRSAGWLSQQFFLSHHSTSVNSIFLS